MSLATSDILSMETTISDRPWGTSSLHASHTSNVANRKRTRQGGMSIHLTRNARQGCFCIMSHNINSLSNRKLQNCVDVIAEDRSQVIPILCLQETKLTTISSPAGMRVEHSPCVGKKGGGLATLVPRCITILETWHAKYALYT